MCRPDGLFGIDVVWNTLKLLVEVPNFDTLAKTYTSLIAGELSQKTFKQCRFPGAIGTEDSPFFPSQEIKRELLE